jgi:hypothetical protein
MVSEKDLLLDIKRGFGWPVDTIRYNIQSQDRFWDGKRHFGELASEVAECVQESWNKIAFARKKIGVLAKIPWVQGIFLTGSVASLNAKIDDDIDIWLIVDKKRIWLTRSLDFFIFTFFGSRRLAKHGVDSNKVKNRLCFNFYSTIDGLVFSEKTPSFAMQLVDAFPLYLHENGVYKKIIEENSWLSEYFPSWYAYQLEQVSVISVEPRAEKVNLLISAINFILDGLEFIAGFLMQIKIHKKLPKLKDIYTTRFTTWESDRILSSYEETITKRGQAIK